MTVFKTFLKILNKNKFIVIMYTVILLIFGGFNFQSNEQSMSFVATKPNIMIINNDNSKFTKNFIKYMSKNSKIVKIENDKDKINDALFYREISYVIYIPKNYGERFLNGEDISLDVKKVDNYEASLASIIISRYLKVAKTYRNSISNEDLLIDKINETLSIKTNVSITSKLDTTALERAAFYYNFVSYSLLACLIYVICLILSIFNNEKVKKRTLISSTSYKKNNRILLLSNCLYASVVWLFYVFISFILIGDVMFTTNGIIYILNSFIFMLCATTLAFLLGSVFSKKDAINGVMNVVALGSSFLCGAFVPQSMLPGFVLKIAKFIPTYYYISNNNKIATLEKFSFDFMKELYINIGIMAIFIIAFILLTNIISNKKRKIA